MNNIIKLSFGRVLLTMVAIVANILPTSSQSREKLLGGDISMLSRYEQKGTVYRDIAGNKVDVLQFFHDKNWNAMRVRLFVDPNNASSQNLDEGVCQNLDYVVALSREIKKAGFKLMLDFHYSDTWADPGKQFTPKRWEQCSAEALADSVYNYTVGCLTTLKRASAEPDLIQVGNEISFGTLWPTARIDSAMDSRWAVLADILNHGARACRKVCPNARLIIHTEKAGDWQYTRSYYNELRTRNVDYDIIGLSYYPMWHRNVGVLAATLDSLAVQFPEHDVMVVETAGYYSHDNDPWSKPDDYSQFYPISPEGQRIFTHELVSELLRHDNVTGLFWWYPEENESGKSVIKGWLNRGLFDNRTGKALPAIDEFSRFVAPSSSSQH